MAGYVRPQRNFKGLIRPSGLAMGLRMVGCRRQKLSVKFAKIRLPQGRKELRVPIGNDCFWHASFR